MFSIPSDYVRALFGGEHTSQNLTDRGDLAANTTYSGRPAWLAVGSPDLRCESSRFPAARTDPARSPGRAAVWREDSASGPEPRRYRFGSTIFFQTTSLSSKDM